MAYLNEYVCVVGGGCEGESATRNRNLYILPLKKNPFQVYFRFKFKV